MTVSHLTTSESALFDQMVTAFEGDYPFNRLTTSPAQWLATVASGLTESSYSRLTSSELALLAASATDLSGSPVSALTSSRASMLATIINNPSEGGGGGEPYMAQAFSVAGETWVEIESLAATDNRYFSFVIWEKMAAADYGDGILYVSDPNTFSFYLDMAASPGEGGTIRNLDMECSNTDDSAELQMLSSTDSITPNQYNCLIGCMDTQDGVAKFYRGDVDVTGNIAVNFGVPFVCGSNGKPLVILGTGDTNSTGDFADIRIMPGVNLLTAGDIVESTRRLFFDENGKPVDPADAITALGTPAVLLRWNGSALVQEGNGGAIIVHGDAPVTAATSPSD